MSSCRAVSCENVTLHGGGPPITAYVAPPSGLRPFSGIAQIHHLPELSEHYILTTRRFPHHGYLAICPNLYEREGGGIAAADIGDAGTRGRVASPRLVAA